MRINDYHALRANGRSPVRKVFDTNPLPSCTDPTQECPVSSFQFGLDGQVVNCKQNNLQFNQVPIDQMTAIESRHRDKFDILGQQQQLAAQASKGLKPASKKVINS